MKYEYSDAGRSPTEKKDCTVRAFVEVTGKEYCVVHDVFRDHGRKNNRGFRLKDHIQSIGRALGLDLRQVKRSGSLAKLIEEFPTGKFVVRVRSHAFAVIDGVVRDTWYQSPHRHIRGAWKVEAVTP